MARLLLSNEADCLIDQHRKPSRFPLKNHHVQTECIPRERFSPSTPCRHSCRRDGNGRSQSLTVICSCTISEPSDASHRQLTMWLADRTRTRSCRVSRSSSPAEYHAPDRRRLSSHAFDENGGIVGALEPVLRDLLIRRAVVPRTRGRRRREFHDHDALWRVALKDLLSGQRSRPGLP